MKTKRVIVLPYDEGWTDAFEAIRTELDAVLGGMALAVEHIGSTSVIGMWAKPCIDIDVIIENRSALFPVIEGLRAIGYIHEGDLGISGREAFAYSDKPHLQKHHLYVCQKDSEELFRHLAFRDYLRANPSAVKKYSSVKIRAAELYPDDIDGYMRYKSHCIEELYRECGIIGSKNEKERI